jgi:hypothetical protein
MSGKYYGFKFHDLHDDDELNEIETFVDEGTPVIIVADLDDLYELGIEPSHVEMVNRLNG